jgi:hypothetical protein
MRKCLNTTQVFWSKVKKGDGCWLWDGAWCVLAFLFALADLHRIYVFEPIIQ